MEFGKINEGKKAVSTSSTTRLALEPTLQKTKYKSMTLSTASSLPTQTKRYDNVNENKIKNIL